MATVMIPSGSNEATSADFQIISGETKTIALKDYDSSAFAHIELKADDGNYVPIGKLAVKDGPARVIAASGTFRVRRDAGVTCGVFLAD